MRFDTLQLLRCPFCGSKVELNGGVFHRIDAAGEIRDALLACRCCEFLVSDGIAVMTLWPEAEVARQAIAEERPADALRAMLNFAPHAPSAQLIGPEGEPEGTYQAIAEGVGEQFEGGYFVYRFSDPTFVVADAVVRSVAQGALDEHSRAIDICGGSGHLTRSLAAVSRLPPVVTDISFIKLWLARHFTAPGAEAVLADAEVPLPFATGAFRVVVCNDAFHYIWHKALLAREMARITDSRGVTAITHTHNAETWTPSQGTALHADHYRALFEHVDARVYSEQLALPDAIGGRIELGRHDSEAALAADQAFFVVAPRDPGMYREYTVPSPGTVCGELRISPLYDVVMSDGNAALTLRYPSQDYEEEYAASRTYLPDTIRIGHDTLMAMRDKRLTADVEDLIRRRVVVDLPPNYLNPRP
jgi:SAM-dependent methyltransferase